MRLISSLAFFKATSFASGGCEGRARSIVSAFWCGVFVLNDPCERLLLVVRGFNVFPFASRLI